jgi:hypothetical protein
MARTRTVTQTVPQKRADPKPAQAPKVPRNSSARKKDPNTRSFVRSILRAVNKMSSSSSLTPSATNHVVQFWDSLLCTFFLQHNEDDTSHKLSPMEAIQRANISWGAIQKLHE